MGDRPRFLHESAQHDHAWIGTDADGDGFGAFVDACFMVQGWVRGLEVPFKV